MFLKEKEDRRSTSLLDRERSLLLVIDAQEKFLPVTQGMDLAVKRSALMVAAAKQLKIPIIVSEQYPKALGSTVAEIATELPPGTPVFEKLSFSAFDVSEWAEAVRAQKRNQIILCGVETQVCILQTALDLIQNLDAQIYVVVDAVASRKVIDKDSALLRLEGHGAQRVTSEMVIFEWFRKAGTPEFKEIQERVKRN